MEDEMTSIEFCDTLYILVDKPSQFQYVRLHNSMSRRTEHRSLGGEASIARSCIWARLLDQDKPPRRWWYPPPSRQDDILQMSEEARQVHQKVVEQAHEKFSETIRLAMLSLLGFALFCLLITFSTPDSSLLVADPTIKMPFADVHVSFQSFLILAPLLLIVITLYLHIFYGYWLDLEADHLDLMRSHQSSEPLIERLPTLFSLDHAVPRFFTTCIFYWLVSLVLLVITWKAAARVAWGIPLVLLTSFVTGALLFLQIRRRPASQRQWNRPLWGMMGLIVGCMVVVSQWLPRRWTFFGQTSKESGWQK
jgi:FtsH-binding integral membrane protein